MTNSTAPQRRQQRHRFEPAGTPADQKVWKRRLVRHLLAAAKASRTAASQIEKAAATVEELDDLSGSRGRRALFDVFHVISGHAMGFSRAGHEADVAESNAKKLIGDYLDQKPRAGASAPEPSEQAPSLNVVASHGVDVSVVDLCEYRSRRSLEACEGPAFEALDALTRTRMLYAKIGNALSRLEEAYGPGAP